MQNMEEAMPRHRLDQAALPALLREYFSFSALPWSSSVISSSYFGESFLMILWRPILFLLPSYQ